MSVGRNANALVGGFCAFNRRVADEQNGFGFYESISVFLFSKCIDRNEKRSIISLAHVFLFFRSERAKDTFFGTDVHGDSTRLATRDVKQKKFGCHAWVRERSFRTPCALARSLKKGKNIINEKAR